MIQYTKRFLGDIIHGTESKNGGFHIVERPEARLEIGVNIQWFIVSSTNNLHEWLTLIPNSIKSASRQR